MPKFLEFYCDECDQLFSVRAKEENFTVVLLTGEVFAGCTQCGSRVNATRQYNEFFHQGELTPA